MERWLPVSRQAYYHHLCRDAEEDHENVGSTGIRLRYKDRNPWDVRSHVKYKIIIFSD